MGQEVCALAHEMRAATQEVPSGPHLDRVDIGLWEHATAQQGGNLLGIDFVVFGFAAVNGFHIQGMAQDEGNPFCSTQVRKPIPGEDTFNGDDETVTIGGNGPEKGFRSRFHIAVQPDFPIVAQDADVHGAGVQVDTTVKWVLLSVESHEVSSSLVKGSFPTASIPLGYAEGEASIIINRLQPTPYSLRSRCAATRERDGRTTSRPQGQEGKYRETGPCGIQVPLPRRAAE
jgi:hypothetical protein